MDFYEKAVTFRPRPVRLKPIFYNEFHRLAPNPNTLDSVDPIFGAERLPRRRFAGVGVASAGGKFGSTEPPQSSKREKVNVPSVGRLPSTSNGSVSILRITSGLSVGSSGET